MAGFLALENHFVIYCPVLVAERLMSGLAVYKTCQVFSSLSFRQWLREFMPTGILKLIFTVWLKKHEILL